jgi:hypothetical protein
MNLQDIKHSTAVFLTAKDISDIMRVDPQSIRNQAKKAPAALGFPISFVGNQLKIPRIPFLQFIGEESDMDAVQTMCEKHS